MTKRRWAFVIALALLLVPAYFFFAPGFETGSRSGGVGSGGLGVASAATLPPSQQQMTKDGTSGSACAAKPRHRAYKAGTARSGTFRASRASRSACATSAGQSASEGGTAGSSAFLAGAGSNDALAMASVGTDCAASWARTCSPSANLLDNTTSTGALDVPLSGASDASVVANGGILGLGAAGTGGVLGAAAGVTGGGIALLLNSGGLAATADVTTGGGPSQPSDPGPTTATPEPVTGTLLGLGLMGWAAAEIRRRRGVHVTDAEADGTP